jgi:hypothetical protein
LAHDLTVSNGINNLTVWHETSLYTGAGIVRYFRNEVIVLESIAAFVARQFPRMGQEEQLYTMKLMMDYAADDLEYWEITSLWDLWDAAIAKKLNNN